MKKLKDFLYDKNDILIALAILIIAALLIVWRMEVIMAYPQTLAEQTDTINTTEDSAVDAADHQANAAQKDNQTDDRNNDAQADSSAQSDENQVWTNGVLTKEITVTIKGGSAISAVQSLIDAGLFTSYDDYAQVCKAAGYTPEHIKATTFTFPSGSTPTDIAAMVTH